MPCIALYLRSNFGIYGHVQGHAGTLSSKEPLNLSHEIEHSHVSRRPHIDIFASLLPASASGVPFGLPFGLHVVPGVGVVLGLHIPESSNAGLE